MNESERMVISAYCDGEVEAPWKEQVARRIAQDPEWAAEESRHRAVKALLAAAPEPGWVPATEQTIQTWQTKSKSTAFKTAFPLLWISTAAAAALLIAAGLGYWAGLSTANTSGAPIAELQVEAPHSLGLKLSGEGQLLMASTVEGLNR